MTERVRTLPCSFLVLMERILSWIYRIECQLLNVCPSLTTSHLQVEDMSFLPLDLSFPRAQGSAIRRQEGSRTRSHRVLKATEGSGRLLGGSHRCQAVQNFTLHHTFMLGLLIERDRPTVALLLNSSLLSIPGKVSRLRETQVLPK